MRRYNVRRTSLGSAFDNSVACAVSPRYALYVDERYAKWRAEVEAGFATRSADDSSRKTETSPSGLYALEMVEYTAGPGRWRYSRGQVRNIADRSVIADIRRNYGLFWRTWAQHANGFEYLLCGEDYQGQTVVNLSKRSVTSYFPEEGYSGGAFCWAAAYPSPSSKFLAVEGCYWACPYELLVFDFGHPDQLPYAEIARFPNLSEWNGWLDDHTFEYIVAADVRKSDGTPYDELSEAEQSVCDNDWSSIETRLEIRRVSLS